MIQMNELRLTPEQYEIVRELEIALRKAKDLDIGIAFDDDCASPRLYAYNGKNVSCFNAPSDAAYPRKIKVPPSELYVIRYGRVEGFSYYDGDILVGMENYE